MKKIISIAFIAISLTSFSIHAGIEYDENGRTAVNQYNCDLALEKLISNTVLIEESQSWFEKRDLQKEIDSIRPFLKLCVEKKFIDKSTFRK